MDLGGRICLAMGGDGTSENGRPSDILPFLKGLVDNIVMIIEAVVTKEAFSSSKILNPTQTLPFLFAFPDVPKSIHSWLLDDCTLLIVGLFFILGCMCDSEKNLEAL
jgi:hypothetical protein